MVLTIGDVDSTVFISSLWDLVLMIVPGGKIYSGWAKPSWSVWYRLV